MDAHIYVFATLKHSLLTSEIYGKKIIVFCFVFINIPLLSIDISTFWPLSKKVSSGGAQTGELSKKDTGSFSDHTKLKIDSIKIKMNSVETLSQLHVTVKVSPKKLITVICLQVLRGTSHVGTIV